MGFPNNKGVSFGDPYYKDYIVDWDLYGGPPIWGNCQTLGGLGDLAGVSEISNPRSIEIAPTTC